MSKWNPLREGSLRQLSRRTFLVGTTALGCSSRLTPIRQPFDRYCPTAACFAVDAHSHTFNGSDLPIDGFLRLIAPGPQKLTDPIIRDATAALEALIQSIAPSARDELTRLNGPASPPEVAGGEALDKLTKTIGEHLPLLAKSKYADILLEVLRVAMSDRRYAAERVCERYPDTKLFVPALVDYDYWSDGDPPKSTMIEQIQVQAALAQHSMRGELAASDVRLHPIVSFNPLKEVREVLDRLPRYQDYEPFGRPDGYPFEAVGKFDLAASSPAPIDPAVLTGSLALVRYAIEHKGFAGVKVYPPVGFLPLDNAGWRRHARAELGAKLDLCLRALYAYCEAMQVPVMTHSANSNGYETGYGMLAEPRLWTAVLDEFPALHLDLGHFGHAEGSTGPLGIGACESWCRQAAELMNRPDAQVYADMANSHFGLYEEERTELLQVWVDLFSRFPIVKQRFMYGSDWWLNELDINADRSLTAFAAGLTACLSEAELRDIMGGNALRYLGYSDPLHRATQRLGAYYDAVAREPRGERVKRPAWLAS